MIYFLKKLGKKKWRNILKPIQKAAHFLRERNLRNHLKNDNKTAIPIHAKHSARQG